MFRILFNLIFIIGKFSCQGNYFLETVDSAHFEEEPGGNGQDMEETEFLDDNITNIFHKVPCHFCTLKLLFVYNIISDLKFFCRFAKINTGCGGGWLKQQE